ncbi:hypothetical protein [Rhodanobacter lindaniclasticus]|uniref:hypothetical protein n=1 Tax=Rhodanobacter lindaniclasticus TaxID=75310 RepID=UPI0014463B1F|nr:hypothetical protein [Rhodanobacter lindaniclasticus]
MFQHVQHMGAAVALAGGADLEEVGGNHGLEVGARAAELGAMEDRFGLAQSFQHGQQSGSGDRIGFDRRVHPPIVPAQKIG